MKRFLVIFIFVLGYSQISWQIEEVDTTNYSNSNVYYWNDIALDTDDVPHTVFNIDCESIIFATRVDSVWQKEVVESGLFYYGFDLVYDKNNNAHLSYYRRDSSLNTTYICHGLRDTTGWQIEVVDSSYGYLGNYFWHFNSSIDIDAVGYPGIAYIAWNLEDSLHYIKYAHYNGVDWDTSIVSRDTSWHHRYPLDWSPSLKFDHSALPHIVFHRIRSNTNCDTLKIANYNDLVNAWIIEPIMACDMDGFPVSLALTSQDYPCIAHGYGWGLAYTWWDGVSWHTDGITSIGVLHIRIRLALDNLDRPHIAFLHWGYYSPRYCYKDTIWHLCGPIESDTTCYTFDVDVSLELDMNNQPHVCYGCYKLGTTTTTFKYAKGTFVGIDEDKKNRKPEIALSLFPNPGLRGITIEYFIDVLSRVELVVYDVSGKRVKILINKKVGIGKHKTHWDGKDEKGNSVPAGVYFVRLFTDKETRVEKAVLIR